MIAIAIVIAILVLLALLRLGVSVEYSEDGLTVILRAGPLRLRAYPRFEKPEKARKKAARRAKKVKKEKKKPEKKRPGGLEGFLEILRVAKTMLGRLRRRLLIKHLTIHFTAASEDPSKTALMFGGANAVIGAIMPALEHNFRIRRRDLRTSADFNASAPGIYVYAAISLAVWEAAYIAAALLPLLVGAKTDRQTDNKGKSDKPEKRDRKDVQSNG